MARTSVRNSTGASMADSTSGKAGAESDARSSMTVAQATDTASAADMPDSRASLASSKSVAGDEARKSRTTVSGTPGDEKQDANPQKRELHLASKLARASGFYGEEMPEDLLGMGVDAAEAERLIASPAYQLLEAQKRQEDEEEAENAAAAAALALAAASVDEPSDQDSASSQFRQIKTNKALEQALRESPIRTKYNPNLKREIDKLKQDKETRQLAEDLQEMAAKIFIEKKEAKKTFLTSLTEKLSSEAKIISSVAKDVGHVAVTGDALRSEVQDRTYGELLQKLNSHIQEDNILQGLPPGSLKAMKRARSMMNIKAACGLNDVHQKNRFQMMREAGMYYHGSQDPSMKRQGLRVEEPHLDEVMQILLQIAEQEDVEDQKDAEAAEDAKPKAITTAADVLERFLRKLGGGSVKRRVPEAHDATFDFAEARICMPRILNDNHGGQLITVHPHLKEHGTEGEVLMKVTLPRRECVANRPNQLDVLIDLKKLAEESKKQPNDNTAKISRYTSRQPPNVKDWEAWREIQRQKRLEENSEDIRKKMGDIKSTEETTDERATSKTTERKGSKEDSKEGGRGSKEGVAVRRAVRSDAAVGLISQRIPAPWDGAFPPEPDDFERIFQKLGLDDDLVTRAAGCAASEHDTEEELSGPALEKTDWIVRATGPRAVQFNFLAMMNREEILMPDRGLNWSFEGENGPDNTFWHDYLLPLPDASLVQRVQFAVLQGCETIQKWAANPFKKCSSPEHATSVAVSDANE